MSVPSDSRDRPGAEDDDPLTAEELANIQSGEEDCREGRMISVEEYERQRGL
jgi:hypothetical protein